MTGPPEPRLSPRIRVQIALISVVALATLLATVLFGEASGVYQEAVRQDVLRQGAVLEDIRHVYGDEAPLAFQVAVAQARADGLSPLRGDGRLAASEYALASQTAFGLRRNREAVEILATDRYLRPGLGYDLPRRLHDVQQRHPGLYALDPDATLRSGDRWVTGGLLSAGVAGAGVLAAVLAAVVVRPRRWRRAGAGPGRRVLRTLELLPQPATVRRPGGHRGAVTLHLAAFALLLLLPLGQIVAAGGEQRAQAEAARKGIAVTTSVAASAERTAFLVAAHRAALVQELHATARELASLDTGTAPEEARHERTVAVAESRVARRIQDIAAYMGRLPGEEEQVDTAAVAVLSAEGADLKGLASESLRQVDLADRASTRGTFLSGATAAAVVTEMLAGTAVAALALAGGAGRRWVWWTGTGALLSATLVAAALL